MTYSYTVNGKEFHGDVVAPGRISVAQSFAERFVKAHPPGSEIRIFYSPAHPQEAVLTTKLMEDDFWFLESGLPIFLGGIAVALASLFSVRSRPSNPS